MPRLGAERFGGDAGRQRDVIGGISSGDAQRTRNHVRLQPAVGIGEQQPVARGDTGAHMACVGLAQPALGQVLDACRTHARILGRESPQDVAGRVGGSIVDDDHLECDMPLREQMTNRRFEACFLIARRHDHRAAHRAGRQAVCRCGERVERRQPPRPPLVVERGHSQADEEGGRDDERDGCPHGLPRSDMPRAAHAESSARHFRKRHRPELGKHRRSLTHGGRQPAPSASARSETAATGFRCGHLSFQTTPASSERARRRWDCRTGVEATSIHRCSVTGRHMETGSAVRARRVTDGSEPHCTRSNQSMRSDLAGAPAVL